MRQSTAQIARAIAASTPVNGIRIVGVDGPSGSGKSWLAARLSAALSAPIIEIDDFVSWDSFAGWWPRFDAQVLTPLLDGRDAVYQARDWTDWYGSSLGGWKTQTWTSTLIVEGVTCTRRETVGRSLSRSGSRRTLSYDLPAGWPEIPPSPANGSCGSAG